MRRMLFVSVLLLLCGTTVSAQVPEIQAQWFHVSGDSVRVEYASPQRNIPYPAVVVLCDRFGRQDNVRAVLKVLAQMGFRAYAPPLRSTPDQAVAGIPEFTYDSTDAAIVTQIAVDIMNDPHCNGKLGLMAFDAGAEVAIDMVRHFPFFKSAALFYPAGGLPVLEEMLDAKTILQLHVAQFDPMCTMEDVRILRTKFIEAGKRLHVFYYKEARRFFFNPQHENYYRKNTETAWNKVLDLFRQTLR